jgi:hypothetical protein
MPGPMCAAGRRSGHSALIPRLRSCANVQTSLATASTTPLVSDAAATARGRATPTRLAEAKVAQPVAQIRGELLHHRRGVVRQFPDPHLEAHEGLRRNPPRRPFCHREGEAQKFPLRMPGCNGPDTGWNSAGCKIDQQQATTGPILQDRFGSKLCKPACRVNKSNSLLCLSRRRASDPQRPPGRIRHPACLPANRRAHCGYFLVSGDRQVGTAQGSSLRCRSMSHSGRGQGKNRVSIQTRADTSPPI